MNIERILNNYFNNQPFLLLVTSDTTEKLTDEQIRDGLTALRDELEKFRQQLVVKASRINGGYPQMKAWNLGGLVATLTLVVREMNVEIDQAQKRLIRNAFNQS